MKTCLAVILAVICCCLWDGRSWGQGMTYPRIEASFNIGGISSDAAVLFDYAQTDVKVAIVQPDSSAVLLPAFYDGGTTWRVRHTPQLAGVYSITNISLNGVPISVSNLQPTNWTITGFPTSAGYIQVDPNSPRHFITSNGRRFFPIGENVAWDSGSHTVTSIFPKLGAAHQNWARVWMNHWDGKNLDWNNNGTSPGPLGVLNLTVAQKWDSIVQAADQSGIYFQMTLQHHGQYSTGVDPNWNSNPYNVANGSSSIGFLTSPIEFFTNATAKAVTKRKLRYSIARWGYSPSIMAWELFNEVQFTTAAQNGLWNLVQSWHNEMAQFIRTQDPYQHLITTSSELTRPIWDETDFYQHHEYPSDLITGIRDSQDIQSSQALGPNFTGECGINTTPHVGISPPIWAGLMSAQSGGAMPWYWDTINPNNDYYLMQAAADFVTLSGWAHQDGLKKSSPSTTGGPIGPLSFAPSGGWGVNQGPDVFTVGSTAPEGIGLSTAYLQGQYNRSLLTNGYKFFVNYPSNNSTFRVQITQIARAGATFRIVRDGVLATNHVFPATSSDTTTQLNISIPVTSGAHTIVVSNAGLDWVRLGNLTLDPYAAQLGAYAVGNTNFTAMWLWHRTNVFRATPGPAVAGTVVVSGLSNATYSAVWWDTFGAGAISNFTFTVPSPGAAVTLPTPAVMRSVALFAGLPARAAIVPPDLNPAVISNAPSFNLPVVITNSGGLPLAYSLSFTGAVPSWLSFSSTNGYVPKLGGLTLQMGINPGGLAPGTYNFTVFVNSSDALLPVTVLPIALTIASSEAFSAPQLVFISRFGSDLVFQMQGDSGALYVLEASPDLVVWTPISSNTLPGGVLNITNLIAPGVPQEFWRARPE